MAARKRRRMKKKFKIIIYIFMLLVVFGAFLIELSISKKNTNSKSISYSKESNLNYITYLKDNSHYEDEYLQKEYNLVASLIDYFNLDYNYTYTLGKSIDYDLEYEIKAILEIYDSDNSVKPIEKKEYTLLEKQEESGSGQIIKVDLYNQKVKYDSYNAIVQEWKKEISPNANLKVSINVNWKGHSDEIDKELSDNCTTEFNVPISQKTVDIKQPNNVSDSGVIKSQEKISKGNMLLMASTLALFLTGLIYVIVYAKDSSKNKSAYEQKVNKILREFDRAITEAKGRFVKEEDEDYIEVKDFMELLDVHDNVNEPIIHYANSEDLTVFVIRNGNITYYTTIRRRDYE